MALPGWRLLLPGPCRSAALMHRVVTRFDRNTPLLENSDLRMGSGDEKVKILILHSQPPLRRQIEAVVAREPGWMICGVAQNANDAMKVIESMHPRVVLVDLSLEATSGLELVKYFADRYPDLLIVAMSIREESFYAERVLRAGAKGYLTPEDGTDRLIDCVRKVLDGDVFISDKMAARMIRAFVDGRGDDGAAMVQNLTDRELEVFELIGQKLSTREIAKKLYLSVKTIESHREHIKDKLQLDSAGQLVNYATEWVTLPQVNASFRWEVAQPA